jgi:two-component system chemotaxis response regulator CheB
MAGKTRVVVVDDSALVRSLLGEIINRRPDMECIGAAADPYVAREMIRNLNPDVITLDVEMPRMDGIDFLAKLMRLRPMPVVPPVAMAPAVAAAVDSRSNGHLVPKPVAVLFGLGQVSTEKIIFIGASTGGTEATREVLTALPPDAPAVMITQHMPPGFTRSYAARLNGLCRIRVSEASDGDRVLPGHAYIAPGGLHLSVERSGANYIARVRDGEAVNRHKPSVEVLFSSAARVVGRNAIGLMLTGMGADGARAMREMREAGAYNVVQDEESCVVFGMPREAIAAGACEQVLPLKQIAGHLMTHLRETAGFFLNRV